MADCDHIVTLDKRARPDPGQIGGKGFGLLQLCRIRVPVPRGFCITSKAYQNHLDRNAIRAGIASFLDTKKGDTASALSMIRKQIIDNPMDEGLVEAIRRSYQRLGLRCVAVRSSATAEDLEAYSSAGLYETYLGITGLSEVCQAVKECWASMWTERAFHYRRKNRQSHLEHGMAVIIQEMIMGITSGVVFTVDPTTGSKSNIVIESCWGLGEGLVSGRIEPDRIFIDRRRLKLRKCIVGSKKAKVVRTGETVPVAAEEAAKPSLDTGLACQLARTAIRIEQTFGRPMDIEWTTRARTFYILQARPVTAQAKLPPVEDRQIWTDANAGEVLPDVVTPLTWSVISPVVVAIFNSALTVIGAELDENKVASLICGRAYFNINAIAGLVRNIPGFKQVDITSVFGGSQGSMGDLANVAIAEEYIPVIRIKLSRAALALPIRMTKMLTLLASNNLEFLEAFKKEIEQFEGVDLKARSDSQLVTLWQEVMRRMCRGLRESGYSGMAMLFYPKVDHLCQKWLGSRPGVMVSQLLAGIGGVESAGSGLALCELARKVRGNPRLREAVLRGSNWPDTRKSIERIEGGRDFLTAWDEFMVEHGHHTRSEIELSYPRWSESPDYLLGMIRVFMSVDTKDDALEQYKKITDRRVRLTRECRERLRNPFKRMMFDFYLTRAQRGSLIRESLKNSLVKGVRVIRRIALEAGERLRERGLVKDVDDVFFLTMDEIQGSLAGAEVPALAKVIARRRNEYRRNLRLRPPHVIKGRFNPDDFTPCPLDKKVRILKGLPVSAGKVVGKARIVLDTQSKERVLPGEILVAPFTDPGWTPYFMTAAGIVVDMGGLLSHGSIVAREYGIPAVVNVGPATSIIKTGQLVEVDGDNGVVRIL